MKVLQAFGRAGALAAMLAIGGCSSTNTQTWPLTVAPRVPAAQGEVQVAAAEGDGNHKVKVEVQHLAPPERVSVGARTYVVWLRPPQGTPQNMGVLQVGQDLKGQLNTKTPYRSFEISVTPEANPGATIPTSMPVMMTRVAAPG